MFFGEEIVPRYPRDDLPVGMEIEALRLGANYVRFIAIESQTNVPVR